MTTPDPFDSADLYTCDDSPEEGLSAITPEEAIHDRAEELQDWTGEFTVYAHERRAVEKGWVESMALDLAEKLSEDYEDEFGGGDDPMIDGVTQRTLATAFGPLIKAAITKHPPWQCEPVGQRTFTADEVRKILEPATQRTGAPLVKCSVCGLRKKPIGRDPGSAQSNGLCDHECPGYRIEPHPDSLWPDEVGE